MQIQILSACCAMLAVGPGADLKATLQGKYDSISSAFSRKDSSVFDHVFAPKFVLVGTNGHKIDRKELISDYKRQMTQLDDMSWTRTLDNVSVSGSTATLTVHGKFKGFLTKPNGKHVFENVTTNKDTWTRQSGSWMLLKTQVMSVEATFDHRRLNRS